MIKHSALSCSRLHVTSIFRRVSAGDARVRRPIMRTPMLSLLALPFLVACTGEGANVATNDHAQTHEASPALETVYSESASRPARAKKEAPTEVQKAAMRVAQEDAEIVRAQDYEAQGAPEGTDDLAKKLRARHPDLVPTREDLRADPTSADKLLFIEEHTALLLEQQRALTLMRHVYTDAVRRRLLDRAQDRSRPDAARSAALQTLAAVADAADSQVQSVLQTAQQDENPRIRKAAGATLEKDAK